jgi:N utilization substance protein B
VSRTEERRAAVFHLYQEDLTRHLAAGHIEGFSRELVEGVEEHRRQLDALIEENAIGWDLERIAPIERAILRVALYEILHRRDIPVEIAIDEAVETAKLYCGSEAPGFVNGILGSVVRNVVGTGADPSEEKA